MRASLIAFVSFFLVLPAMGETLTLAPVTVTDWKAVYGRVEPRDVVPARARIGGTIEELLASEGDDVKAGQRLATVHDDKIAFQIAALDAQLRGLQSQLKKAQAEFKRGKSLVNKGVITAQRLDQLRTDADVTTNQIASVEAQRSVVVQQAAEGAILAPASGKILTVSITKGAVVLPGEVIATLGGGGFFLRLAIPERHSSTLKEGAEIRLSTKDKKATGRLEKIYPKIENGRVIADVAVDAIDDAFVNARILVEVPVGSRQALMVPTASIITRSGIDFIKTKSDDKEVERAIIAGNPMTLDDREMSEIISGLNAGDTVILP